MSILKRLMRLLQARRARQKAVEDDATLLVNILGSRAYGEADRWANDQVDGANHHGRPKGHWAAVKYAIARLERLERIFYTNGYWD